jgi:hypothetical protein
VGLVDSILYRLFPPQSEPIAELILGRVATVRGRVVPRDVLESPLTGEPCVYYNYSVEEWRETRLTGPNDGFWRLAEHDEAIAEFYLQDDSGRAIVAPQRVRIDRSRGSRAHAVDLGISTRRASEILIRPGDVVEVSALVDRVDDLYDDARDYRARPRTHFLRAPDSGPLIIHLTDERSPEK